MKDIPLNVQIYGRSDSTQQLKAVLALLFVQHSICAEKIYVKKA